MRHPTKPQKMANQQFAALRKSIVDKLNSNDPQIKQSDIDTVADALTGIAAYTHKIVPTPENFGTYNPQPMTTASSVSASAPGIILMPADKSKKLIGYRNSIHGSI